MQFNPILPQSFGNPPFQVSAITDIEGVTPIYSTTHTNIVNIFSGNWAKINSAGDVIINADFYDEAGNFSGRAATGIHIYRTYQVLTQGLPVLVSELSTEFPTYLLSGESSARLPVYFKSWDTGVAVISGNYAQIIGPGAVIISVEQSGDFSHLGGRYAANPSGTVRTYTLPF
jgi:hypothetical protein